MGSELEKDLRNLYQDGQLLTQIIQNEANNISSISCDETTQWTEENIKELTLISDNIIDEILKGQDKLNTLFFFCNSGKKPNYFEFWQGRSNRLHDRICYTLEKNEWLTARLAP